MTIGIKLRGARFVLHDDGRISGKKLKPSRPLAINVTETGGNGGRLARSKALTVSIITEDWDYVKTIIGPGNMDRRSANQLMAHHLRYEARVAVPLPPLVPLPPPVAR